MSLSVLATYGTLMREYDSQATLGVQERLTFVERCRWDGRLYDLGRFPGAVPGEGTVHGELFRVETPSVWPILDRYEGYDPDDEAGSLFVRRRVPLQRPDGQVAWVYWYNGERGDAPRVPSGDWAAYGSDRSSP